MLLELLRSAGLAVALIASPPDFQFRISEEYTTAFFAAQERAIRTNAEEFYCIGGRIIGDKVVSVTVVKPRQATTYKFGFNHVTNELTQEWRVYHDSCPPGTLADIHTHPGTMYIEQSSKPSETDLKTWRATPYPFHLLTYSDGNRHFLILYVRVGDDFVEHSNVEVF